MPKQKEREDAMIGTNQDYLWDRSGLPDSEIEVLEGLLRPFRVQEREPEWNQMVIPDRRVQGGSYWVALVKQRWLPASLAFAFLAVAVIALSIDARFKWRPGEPWNVNVLQGSPQLSGSVVTDRADLVVGQFLTTDSKARASIRIANLGVVDVAPSSRIRLIATNAKHHRIALEYGTISVHMWAPPFSLAVDTPSTTVFDLGCAFTLHVEQNGRGRVQVTSGWIEFQTASRNVIVPAGAEATTQPGLGPGTPYFTDATPVLKAAVAEFDSHANDDSVRSAALQSILENARPRDALTLLSLMNQLPRPQRAMLLDRLALLVPIPSGYTRDDVLGLRQDAMDAYWNALHLGSPKSWIMHWKDVLTY
jgi:hypothetical protein